MNGAKVATVTRQYRAWCDECLWHGPERIMAIQAGADARVHDKETHDVHCAKCDHDDHRCGGCGEPLDHGQWACSACKQLA